MTRSTRVTLSVASSDPETITRAGEALSRAAAGLALEDVDAIVIFAEDESGGPS